MLLMMCSIEALVLVIRQECIELAQRVQVLVQEQRRLEPRGLVQGAQALTELLTLSSSSCCEVPVCMTVLLLQDLSKSWKVSQMEVEEDDGVSGWMGRSKRSTVKAWREEG
jgi:hypothetical protein